MGSSGGAGTALAGRGAGSHQGGDGVEPPLRLVHVEHRRARPGQRDPAERRAVRGPHLQQARALQRGDQRALVGGHGRRSRPDCRVKRTSSGLSVGKQGRRLRIEVPRSMTTGRAEAAASRLNRKVSHSLHSSCGGNRAMAWQSRPLSQPTVQSPNVLNCDGCGRGGHARQASISSIIPRPYSGSADAAANARAIAQRHCPPRGARLEDGKT